MHNPWANIEALHGVLPPYEAATLHALQTCLCSGPCSMEHPQYTFMTLPMLPENFPKTQMTNDISINLYKNWKRRATIMDSQPSPTRQQFGHDQTRHLWGVQYGHHTAASLS